MAYQNRTPGSIFEAWSGKQVGAFWFVIFLCVASTVFLTVPVGLAFFAALYLLPMIWKDPDDMNPMTGPMTYDSRGWKIAKFMQVIKERKSHLFSPTVALGFGPPEEDIHKDLTPHIMMPPTRIAAYWSLGFGVCASLIDLLIHPYLYPLWSNGFIPPVALSMIVSAVFFFMFFQVFNAAQRYSSAATLAGVDHKPAVMFNKIPRDGSVKGAIFQGFLTSLLGFGIGYGIVMIILATKPEFLPNKIYAFALVTFVGLTMFTFGVFKNLSRIYSEEFMHQVERREAWNDIWGYKKDHVPFFEMEVPVPGVPGKPGGPPEGEEPGETHVWVATFAYPMNGGYVDYARELPKIKPSISNAEIMCITPIPNRDDSGNSIPGTVSSEGFRVWWSDINVSMQDLLEDEDSLTPEHKEVAIRANVVDPIGAIKGINLCIMHSYAMMTSPESKVHIMRVTIVPPNGVTESDFISRIPQISSALGVKWVRAKSSVDDYGKTVINLYIGDGKPNAPGIEYPKGLAASRFKQTLLSVDWEYSFAINKVLSSEGVSPSMMMSKSVMGTSNQIVFDLPPGIPFSAVEKASEGLMTSSGNQFLEMHKGVTDEKSLTRREKREINRYMKEHDSVSQFTAVASPTHPLEKIFLFSEYSDKLISGRDPGVTKIAWSPGVRANGTLAVHDFGSDMPHLVLAGSSGSGKSVLIYSMICQLIANNAPEDLQIWIIDPKIGYQNFEGLDSVTRYVDSWTPSEDFFRNCRDLFHEAVEEMKRRNRIFRFAQRDGYAPAGSESIDKLSVARRLGFEQGPLPDGSPNPLINPYIFIIIDEAALLFAGATDPETKDLQKEILYYATRLARESRSAGIHCLFSTQYPTKESLPSIIKQQSGRLGLKTQDIVASKVIIDKPGLEDLTLKGEGMIVEGSSAYTFRGFLLEEDSLDEHSMTKIINDTPRIVDEQGNSVGKPGARETIDIPLPDDSVFAAWDSDASGAAERLRVTLDNKDRREKGEKFEEIDRFEKAQEAMDRIEEKFVEKYGSEKGKEKYDEWFTPDKFKKIIDDTKAFDTMGV